MAFSAADKRRVYVACRAIFTGNNAQLRKQKKIRELVDKHESSLGPLIRDFGAPKVVEILRILLESRIFESDMKAKMEFPELFLSSPVRDVQRSASENDAARSAAEALEEIASLEERNHEPDDDNGGKPLQGPSQAGEVAAGLSTTTLPPPDDLPSLYPSYLPYSVQHLILTTAQRVLEECCFDFAKKWLPSILQDHGWDCAEAIELTRWTWILAKRSAKLPTHALKSGGSPLNEVLFSTQKLRHTAVHRLPTTARGISQLIQSAMKLAEILQDALRAAQLEELHNEIDSKINAMELNKNVLEDSLRHELEQIRRQREELDRKEEELKTNMLREDRENKSLIGLLLEESVWKIFDEELESRAILERNQDDSEGKTDDELNGFTEGINNADKSRGRMKEVLEAQNCEIEI